MKKKLLLAVLLLAGMNVAIAQEAQDDSDRRAFCMDDTDDCCNSLKIKDLCAKKVKANQGLFHEICVESIKAKSICADNIGVTSGVSLTNLCANNLNATELCVTGTARFNEICGVFRASVALAADKPYVLSTPVEFDLITDDPNGDVTLAPFRYHTPVTGYYIASIQVDVENITGTNVILGVPVSNLRLKVNGQDRRQSFLPFLTFNNAQQAELTFLLILQAGDIITVEYELLIVGASGTQPYVGNATLQGGGLSNDTQTIFKIHYLSSTCNPAVCTPCILPIPPCNVNCSPLPNSCASIVSRSK